MIIYLSKVSILPLTRTPLLSTLNDKENKNNNNKQLVQVTCTVKCFLLPIQPSKVNKKGLITESVIRHEQNRFSSYSLR